MTNSKAKGVKPTLNPLPKSGASEYLELMRALMKIEAARSKRPKIYDKSIQSNSYYYCCPCCNGRFSACGDSGERND